MNTYGHKMYKLSLDGGMTCPNRDGSKGTRGCIFCSEGGSGEFACSGESINEQIENAKSLVSSKCRNVPQKNGYIAYFQAYTNTYAPVKRLRELFMPVIEREDIGILSIATRPDCLPDDVLDLLEELNRIKPVWVELGLQTIHEESARRMRRGYTLDVFNRAVEELHRRNIKVIVHLILFWPGETVEDMKESVRYVCDKNVFGIKLQMLQVLKETDLAYEFEAAPFELPDRETYADTLKELISIIPENVVIHRLTGDGPKKLLIEPKWCADKKATINVINRVLGES